MLYKSACTKTRNTGTPQYNVGTLVEWNTGTQKNHVPGTLCFLFYYFSVFPVFRGCYGVFQCSGVPGCSTVKLPISGLHWDQKKWPLKRGVHLWEVKNVVFVCSKEHDQVSAYERCPPTGVVR